MGAVVGSGILLLMAFMAVIGALIGMPKITKKIQSTNYGRDDVVHESKNYYRTWVMLAAIPLVILSGVIFWASGNQSVPTKSVGVLTSYGKVLGTPYGPGSHWFVPWKTLNIVSDTIQSDSFLQANGTNGDSYTNSGANGNCITIRLGGQQQGCADVQLQTQTDPAAIPNLYANYSSYGVNLTQDVDKFVVKRDLTTVLNRVLGDYNPVQDVSAQLAACDLKQVTTCSTSTASQFSQFDQPLLTALQAALGSQVKVLDINLQYIHYNDSIEQALSKIQSSYTQTAVETQQEQTNAAISAANKALVSQTGALSPEQLQQECFSIVQQAEKSGYQLPLTWGNCLGGSSSTAPPVIVNSTK